MNETNADSEQHLIEKWKQIQLELRHKLILSDTEEWAEDINKIELIGGIDISYDKTNNSKACVTSVVLDVLDDLNIVYKNNTNITVSTPYIAGFLAFREIEFLVKEVVLLRENKPQLIPQVWLIDGNGILHPLKFGLASHLGVLIDSPVIGVAKNPYYLNFVDKTTKDEHKRQLLKLKKKGDSIPIRNSANEVIGVALKTSTQCKNPVYVSIGNKISLNTAIKVVLKCCKFKVPEPTRLADIISRQQISLK